MRSVVVLCGLLVASPAVAQDTTSAPAPEKKICKTIVPTGSIMGKRFCNARTVDVVTGRSKMSAPKGGGDL